MPMKVRIFIADDHEVVRGGMKALLTDSRPEWEVCGEAADGAQAVTDAIGLKPDIALLDISMPVMNGLEACVRMKEAGVQWPILIFTMHESERLETDVREANAQGFVLKSQAFRDLIHAIETLLAGGTFFGAEPLENKPPDNLDHGESVISLKASLEPGFT
jgi:DNA-binding NarL/FixJ family response regulator